MSPQEDRACLVAGTLCLAVSAILAFLWFYLEIP